MLKSQLIVVQSPMFSGFGRLPNDVNSNSFIRLETKSCRISFRKLMVKYDGT